MHLLMPLAMSYFRSKSVSVIVSIFILKLVYVYKVTEKKRLIYMHLLLYYVALIPGPQERRKLVLPGSINHNDSPNLLIITIILFNFFIRFRNLDLLIKHRARVTTTNATF